MTSDRASEQVKHLSSSPSFQRSSASPDLEGRCPAFVHAGQVFASAKPSAVSTVLGSCVAVCLWDASARVGGANHYMLPHWADTHDGSSRFGNVAIRTLIERVLTLGASRANLRAKVFGGACVIASLGSSASILGDKNVRVAFEMLRDKAIPVVASDVGGSKGRRLVFHTDDGDAWVRLI
jgi:chemotaxis protein CheD